MACHYSCASNIIVFFLEKLLLLLFLSSSSCFSSYHKRNARLQFWRIVFTNILSYFFYICNIDDRNFPLLYFIDGCLIFLATMVSIGS